MSAFEDLEILLVEDNEGDIRLTIEAFKEAKIRNHIRVVRDGEEALAYLKKEAAYARKVCWCRWEELCVWDPGPQQSKAAVWLGLSCFSCAAASEIATVET